MTIASDPTWPLEPPPSHGGAGSHGPGVGRWPPRRGFLRAATGLPLGAASWRLWAAPGATAHPRTVVVFLRGACDGLSALVPYAEAYYREARPTLALPAPLPPLAEPVPGHEAEASLRLDERWALAPALAPSFGAFWDAGQLVAVPFAGTGFVSRSHFEAQDWIEFGQPTDAGRPDGSSGFLNRLLARLSGAPGLGIAFTQGLPPSLRGQRSVLSAPVGRALQRRPGTPAAMRAAAAHDERLLAMYAGHRLEPLVREGLALRRDLEAGLARDMQEASREALSAGGFALEASRIGRLMRERPDYTLGFVDVGGWDTHAAQGGATGYLAGRLRALGDGLLALADALGPAEWRRSVVVVLSEFGRTFRENGARGTDHGHGNVLWVLGGAVHGGRIAGEQARLAPGALHQDRDLPVLNEYRAVLGGLFARVYGLDAAALQAVFPRSRPIDLSLA
jgi:uncharacterized protein (DUF1501 family)